MHFYCKFTVKSVIEKKFENFGKAMGKIIVAAFFD